MVVLVVDVVVVVVVLFAPCEKFYLQRGEADPVAGSLSLQRRRQSGSKCEREHILLHPSSACVTVDAAAPEFIPLSP